MGLGALGRRFDDAQQSRRWTAFPVAVWKKFSDDQSGSKAGLLSYYAFVAIFPLLLVLVTILGVVLRSDPELQTRVLDSALADFPVIGEQLRSNVTSLDRTGIGLVVGLLGTFIGARGVASTAQDALNSCWGVPFTRRPGFPGRTLRSLGLLLLLGTSVIVTGTLSGIGGGSGTLGSAVRVGVLLLSLAVNVVAFTVAFRVATAGCVRTRELMPGAVLAALFWQVLLALGGYVVTHQLRRASAVYGSFAIVIGMLAWLRLQAQLTLYAVEADVVRARRLWPRSLLQPPLTDGDQRAYESYAHAQRRRPEQRIDVDFDGPSEEPDHGPPDELDDGTGDPAGEVAGSDRR